MPDRSLPQRVVLSFAILAVGTITLLDMAAGPVLRPIGQFFARSSPIKALEQLSRRLPAYAALVLLIVPLAVAEPAKVYALYLIGEEHYLSGVALMAAAYAVSLVLADTIYSGARPQLRSIRWFAALIDYISAIRARVMDIVRSSRAYQAAARTVRSTRVRVQQMLRPART